MFAAWCGYRSHGLATCCKHIDQESVVGRMPRGDAVRGAGLSSYYEPRLPSSFSSLLGSSNATTFPKNPLFCSPILRFPHPSPKDLSLSFSPSSYFVFLFFFSTFTILILVFVWGEDFDPADPGPRVELKLRRQVNKLSRIVEVQKARLFLFFAP